MLSISSSLIPKAITNFLKKKQPIESSTVDIESINAGNRAARAAQRVGMGINAITAAINAASLAATVWSSERDQDKVELIAAAAGRAAAKYWEDAMKLEYNIQPTPDEVIGDISTFTSPARFDSLNTLLIRLDKLTEQSKIYKDSKDTKRFKQDQAQIEQIRDEIDYVINDEILAANSKSKQDPRTSLAWTRYENKTTAQKKDALKALEYLEEANLLKRSDLINEAEQRVQETDKNLKDAMEITNAAIRDKEEQLYPNDGPAEKRMELAILNEIAAAADETTAANDKIAMGKKRAADAAIRDKEEQLYQLYPNDSPAKKRMELAILKEEEAAVAADTKAANYKIAMDKNAAYAGEAEANRVSELTMEQAKVEQLELERKDDIIARKLMANNAVSETTMEEDKAIKMKQKAIKSKEILELEKKETFSQIKRQKLSSEIERAMERKDRASTIIFNWDIAYLAWKNVVKKITELEIRELDTITPEDDEILVKLEQFASGKTDTAMKIIDDRIQYIKTNYNVLLPDVKDVKQELDSLESSWKTANERKIEEILARIKDLNLRQKLGLLNLQETNELERLKANAHKLNVSNMLSHIPQESLYESNGGAQRHKKYTRKNKKRTRKHKKNKGKKTRAHRITRYKH